MKAATNLVVNLVRALEMLLVLFVFAGILVFSFYNLNVLMGFDWRQVESFYEFINRMLLLVIGLELIRMLVVHDLMAVLELLAFVIARKMLKPDVDALQLLYAVIAFSLLMLARRVLLLDSHGSSNLEHNAAKEARGWYAMLSKWFSNKEAK